jgi:hypothetical protein
VQFCCPNTKHVLFFQKKKQQQCVCANPFSAL